MAWLPATFAHKRPHKW